MSTIQYYKTISQYDLEDPDVIDHGSIELPEIGHMLSQPSNLLPKCDLFNKTPQFESWQDVKNWYIENKDIIDVYYRLESFLSKNEDYTLPNIIEKTNIVGNDTIWKWAKLVHKFESKGYIPTYLAPKRNTWGPGQVRLTR